MDRARRRQLRRRVLGAGAGLRDRAAYAAIMHTPTLRYSAVGFALLAFTGYGIGFWVPPYFLRVRGVSESHAGLDPRRRRRGRRLARRDPRRSVVGSLAAHHSVGAALCRRCGGRAAAADRHLDADDRIDHTRVRARRRGQRSASRCGSDPAPRRCRTSSPRALRATASAAYLLVVTFIGLALGPYTIGRLSVALGDLRLAMLLALLVNPSPSRCCCSPRATSRLMRRRRNKPR